MGYAALSHSLLRSSALLTGGSARGLAVLCYAKDISHLNALAGTGGGGGGARRGGDRG